MRPNGVARLPRIPPLYFGQVATNCKALTHKAGGISTCMSRSAHIATDNITSLQVMFANWYWELFPAKTELGSGGTMTVKASVEYPAGTFTQILFSGSATSSAIADGGQVLSDAVSVTIPTGARFYIREYSTWSASNLVYISGFSVTGGTYDPTNSTIGEAMNYISATDQTMSGTVTASAGGDNGPIRRPVAILANTRVPSVAIVGDSIACGRFDKYDSDENLGFGRFLAALPSKVGFIMLAGDGETITNQKSNFAKRGALIQYCSHVWQQGGVNDLTAAVSNRTAAQVMDDLYGTGGLMTTYAQGKKIIQCTIIPPTTSSDSWATLGNQTIDANNAELEAFNTAVRAGLSGAIAVTDFAALLESGTSGKRIVNGTASYYQPDTVHPSKNAYVLCRDSNLVSSGTFRR